MTLARLRQVRLTIGEVMGIVAALAVSMRWPEFLIPTAAVLLASLFARLGMSTAGSLTGAVIVGLLVGYCLPTTHCGHLKGPSTTLTIAPTAPASAGPGVAPTFPGGLGR